MSSSNVPPVQFTLTGLVLPQESDILAGAQADINAAFGGGLDQNLETPQGQIASSLTAIIGDANDNFAQFVNQVDPAFAAGRMQDAIGRIYFIDRKPAEPTAVQCNCLGLPGVSIPVGSLAGPDSAGNVYVATGGGIIPAGGVLSLPFANLVTGPIPCAAGTLNKIYQAIPGWDSITNPADGVLGRLVESRNDFEFRRQQSVALNGRGSLPSIYGNVFNVSNVLDCYVYENTTNAAITVGSTNYSLKPHSLYVAAVGGDPQAIAMAIWLKKDVGCDYNGNTTETVYDMSGYNAPYPAYTVTFNIPTSTPINFAVTLKNDPNLPANITTLVQNAIIAAFTGIDGGSRARIGSEIYASRFYAGIVALSPFIGIKSLYLGTGSGSPTATDMLMGIDQVPTVAASNITVTLA